MTKNDVVGNPRPAIASTVERVLGSWNERLGGRIGAESLGQLGHEEVLVVDDRAALRPAQIVETKLTRLLQEASLPVSHLQMKGLLRMR
jgi:hypothetical protein